MKRRDFLQSSAIGCALALSYPSRIAADAPPLEANNLRPPDSFELEELTISELQQGMARGKFTSKSLVNKYLDRINEVDKKGPAVNSVIEINPDAEAIAEALDRERKAKGSRGPLHGIPLLIKDNIDTADRMMTTAGSLALLGSIPSRMPSSLRSCAKPASSYSARPTSANGRISDRRTHQADGVDAAARPEILTCWIAIPADRVQVRERQPPPTSSPRLSAPKRTVRLFVPHQLTHLSALNPRSVWSVGRGSFRLLTVRTRPAR